MGKRLQLRLLSDALTGEWRVGEAGEGQGSEPREPWGTLPPGRRCVMKAPPVGPVGEDITCPDQVTPRGRKASSTRKIKPQTSNPFQVSSSQVSQVLPLFQAVPYGALVGLWKRGFEEPRRMCPMEQLMGGYSKLRNSPESSWLGQPRVTVVPNLWYAPVSSESSGSAPKNGFPLSHRGLEV